VKLEVCSPLQHKPQELHCNNKLHKIRSHRKQLERPQKHCKTMSLEY